MAFEIPGFTYSRPADADHRANQFRCMVLAADGDAALAGANVRIIGILQNDPNIGEAATVQRDGISKAEAGAAFAIAALLATDATGRLVTAAGGQQVVAIALTAGGGAGQIASVLLGYQGLA